MLFPAWLSLIGSSQADDLQGQRDCANLRIAVLQLVGDWSKELFLASRHMSRDGWLDANVANSAFKDVQLAVMYFDYAYEALPKTRKACRTLAMKFGTNVGGYIDRVRATGTRSAEGIARP
ncbi:hypothetical protein [Devosia epidermidihirudinis]|nr:hypothetical protein [Devosia epidermidihirudinis]